ncbi:hypothetical protein CONPUDRAFT_136355 [Coniophora puteana RWD-64-598 SS2]|uniref:F-box domain-containing protein n=1 Tax=Coniophora puteana (strain RWD-64-598) TaxID=741705 RepID=A0A5M3MVS5_CONPW|nr:uncharacterized protein CONPUDRAFT_136355 [Coniophora puteana RWD-64-598 SS2]EIW83262.1 hypothetical protein CONPUDRAFT_136355 [Coniophora puteana RWD-64-598 SS2]
MFSFNVNSSSPRGDMPQRMNILLRAHTAPIGCCSYDSSALSPSNSHAPSSSQDSFYDDDFRQFLKRIRSSAGPRAAASTPAPKSASNANQKPSLGRSISTSSAPAIATPLAHVPALTTINKIPTELLQEVFKRCLPSSFESADPYITPDARSAPLLFGQVCQHWRAVSHTSSELWSSLAVKHTSRAAHRALVRAWLARSRGRKLAISFVSSVHLPATLEAPSDQSDAGEGGVPSIAEILASHAEQIHTLSLRASWPVIESLLLRLSHLPHLTSLSLHQHPGSYSVHITPGLLASPKLLPAVRSLSLSRCSDACITAQPALAARLTTLRVTLQRGFDLAAVLAACPALEALTVRTPGYPDNNLVHLPPSNGHGAPSAESPLVHANLRALELELDECAERSAYLSYLAGVLRALALPALGRLACTLLNEDDEDVCVSRWALLGAVQGLAARAERPLERVAFVGFAPVRRASERERVVRATNAKEVGFVPARARAVQSVCQRDDTRMRSSASTAKLRMVQGLGLGEEGPCYL